MLGNPGKRAVLHDAMLVALAAVLDENILPEFVSLLVIHHIDDTGFILFVVSIILELVLFKRVDALEGSVVLVLLLLYMAGFSLAPLMRLGA